MNNRGAALVIVLSMLSLLSGFVLHAWFISSFEYDIATQQIVWYKNFYATKAGLHMGIATVRVRFDEFYKRAQMSPQFIDVSIKDSSAAGSVMLLVQKIGLHGKPMLLLFAQCMQQGHCACCLRCVLTKQVMTVDNKREQYFVASGFCFGTDI